VLQNEEEQNDWILRALEDHKESALGGGEQQKDTKSSSDDLGARGKAFEDACEAQADYGISPHLLQVVNSFRKMPT
jgi:hypothetical protein